jgi:hypothetical protein
MAVTIRINSTLSDFNAISYVGRLWCLDRIAPLMVTYHYVKFYVSIIIHLEVININVRNFNFPIGFYSNPHPLWTPQNMPRIDSRHWTISTGHHFQNGHHNTAKIQYCPISSKFDMWVDNDVPNWFPILHHYLPTYQILMISDNIEFLQYCGGHFENGDQ